MELSINKISAVNDSFEIERDMRVSSRPHLSGKMSVQEYIEFIVARYPLLGAVVLKENIRKAVEDSAIQAIKFMLDNRNSKMYDWAYLTVLLTMVQYAKGWDRQSNAGFWAYIAEQFGYKYSSQMYSIFTTSVKEACRAYNRLFVIDPNGDNNYYSTM